MTQTHKLRKVKSFLNVIEVSKHIELQEDMKHWRMTENWASPLLMEVKKIQIKQTEVF